MRNFLISFLLATLIMIPTEIFAADYETPHEFSAGDTLSADMMNELFDYIKLSKTTVSSSDIVGTYLCTQTTICGGYAGGASGGSLTGATCDSDNIIQSREDTVTFTSDGDGTYSFSTSKYQFFERGDNTPNATESGSYIVTNFVIVFNDGSNKTPFILTKPSKNRFIMSFINIAGGAFNFIKCDKQNLPPTTPATLNASASGKTVSLTWSDSSTDETGFKVLRKDSLTGSYSTVTTTSADATSYSDTVTAAGSYWYRVSATNSNGDSVASKMVKVDVE